MFVIALGNLTVGYTVVGPFETYEAAERYAADHVADGYAYIFRVYPPETRDAP